MAPASFIKNISLLSLPSLVHTPSDTDTDTDTDQNTDSDSDIDLDLLEEVELDITDYDCDIPTRPASRLGFNRALIQGQRQMEDLKASEIQKTPHLHSAVTLRWTTGLFQKTNMQPVSRPVSDSTETRETAPQDLLISPASSVSSGVEKDSDPSKCSVTSDDENTSSVPTKTILCFPTPPCGSHANPQVKLKSCRPAPFPIIRSSGPSPEFRPEHTPNHTPGPPPLFSTIPQGRQKFSCLPSPFSPSFFSPPAISPFFAQTLETHRPCHNPLRHNYANRGHSRNALLHLKYFWSTRHDEWMTYEYECSESSACTKMDIFSDNGAYGGLAVLPRTARFGSQLPSCPPVPPPSRSSANKTSPSPPPPPPPPLTIHPRTGDITALRDPYCMHIDVCFAGLPLWTLGKTLWMFEVHKLDGRKEEKKAEDGRNREGVETRGLGQDMDTGMTCSTSVGSSESSDATLVEDVPMAEPACLSSSLASKIEKAAGNDARKCIVDVDMDAETDMSMIQEDDALFNKYLLEDVNVGEKTTEDTDLVPTTTMTTAFSQEPPSRTSPTSVVPWELTWYARWELLVELVRRDQARGQGIVPGAVPGKDKPGRRMFYLGDDDDDDYGHMDIDDEEEDDYGVLVANPVYPPSRVFDTGIRK